MGDRTVRHSSLVDLPTLSLPRTVSRDVCGRLPPPLPHGCCAGSQMEGGGGGGGGERAAKLQADHDAALLWSHEFDQHEEEEE